MTSQQPTLSQENVLPELKGAPLSVLLALWQKGPSGRKGLIQRTGWKKDAVSAALKRLVRLKLVVRHNHRQWGVARGVSVPQLLGVVAINRDGPQRRQERRSLREERENGSDVGKPPETPAAGNGRPSRSYTGKERTNQRAARGDETAGRRESRSSHTRPERPGRLSQDDENPVHTAIAAAERRLSQSATHNRQRMPVSRARIVDHDLSDDPQPDPDFNKNKRDDNDHEEVQAVIQSLQSLNPPFDRAEAWLKTVPLGLVARWLAYLAVIPRSQRDLIQNEAAFVRSRVRKRIDPPLSKYQERPSVQNPYHEEPSDTEPALEPLVESGDECARCGRTYYDTTGNCLVCMGVIKV